MKVSIIIPVIRPDKAERCINALRAGMEPSKHEEFVVRLRSGKNIPIEIIAAEDVNSIGCPAMVAKLTALAKGEHILFLGDDTIPQPGFLTAALEAMATLPDGWGLVALNDGIHNGAFATHWLASKKLLEHTGGEFFHTGYKHCFCDRELTDIAKELGRYVYAPEAKIVHDHPVVTGEDLDEGYKRAYDPESFKADQLLYWRRKRERSGFKLGIGFPLCDPNVPSEFMLSVLCMVPSEYKLFVPRFPAGKFADSIASVRNDLVEQALEAGCTHLLMCDTDQVYPADTIEKLLSHEKPIVGAAVHRRWPPFDLIMFRGEIGTYQHVPEDECYSGELVEVDSTGTGCVLFDMGVFLDIPRPWFEFGKNDGKPVGEDIMLCSKARAAGIPIFVDTSVQVDHLTTLRVNKDARNLFRKETGHTFGTVQNG